MLPFCVPTQLPPQNVRDLPEVLRGSPRSSSGSGFHLGNLVCPCSPFPGLPVPLTLHPAGFSIPCPKDILPDLSLSGPLSLETLHLLSLLPCAIASLGRTQLPSTLLPGSHPLPWLTTLRAPKAEPPCPGGSLRPSVQPWSPILRAASTLQSLPEASQEVGMCSFLSHILRVGHRCSGASAAREGLSYSLNAVDSGRRGELGQKVPTSCLRGSPAPRGIPWARVPIPSPVLCMCVLVAAVGVTFCLVLGSEFGAWLMASGD